MMYAIWSRSSESLLELGEWILACCIDVSHVITHTLRRQGGSNDVMDDTKITS